VTIEDGIGWTWVSNQDKEALRGLQSFQCTTDRPKSPGGRALRHPKPWELEVQSYFRDRGCGRAKKRGTRRLLLARRSGVIVAAADTEVSISKDGDGSYVNFFICAVAINVSERGKGGRLARDSCRFSRIALCRKRVREGCRGPKCMGALTLIMSRVCIWWMTWDSSWSRWSLCIFRLGPPCLAFSSFSPTVMGERCRKTAVDCFKVRGVGPLPADLTSLPAYTTSSQPCRLVKVSLRMTMRALQAPGR
jgi:hypothetical protein